MLKEFLLLEHMLIILGISVGAGQLLGLEAAAGLQSVQITLY